MNFSTALHKRNASSFLGIQKLNFKIVQFKIVLNDYVKKHELARAIVSRQLSKCWSVEIYSNQTCTLNFGIKINTYTSDLLLQIQTLLVFEIFAPYNNRQQTIAAHLLSYRYVKKYRIFILFITIGGYG